MNSRNFGRIVREKRELKRLTISRTAELANMSEEGLGLIELGISNPKLASVLSIAAVLNINLGDIEECKPEEIAETVENPSTKTETS